MSGTVQGCMCHSRAIISGALGITGVLPQEYMVTQFDAARSINPDHLLIDLAYFNDCASFIPFDGMGTSLILDANSITNM